MSNHEASNPSLHPSPNPYLADNFAPVQVETTARSLPVRGAIPRALRGRFMRHGPNPMQVPDPARHGWFVGDGMLHITELRDGSAVAYRNRYIRTSPVTSRLGEPAVPGAPAPVIDGSNTNVIRFANKLLSVAEVSLPYAIRPDGETLERLDFGGALSHGLSAHCKIDPKTGELHNVAHRPVQPPFAVWQVFDRDGKLLRNVPIDLAAPGLWHTFSLTDRYVVLYDAPVQFSWDRAEAGWSFPYAFNPSHQTRIGLLERAGDGRVQWIDVPAGVVNHDVGAHDTATGVTAYVTYSDRIYDRDCAGPLEAPPRLVRLDIDATAGTVCQTTIDDRAQEFPRANPAMDLRQPRYLYAVGAGPGRRGGGVLEVGNAMLKHDLVERRTELCPMGPTRATAEATFIADPERADAEDGGWLMSYVYDASCDRSDLVIVDAQHLAAGPIATISLPARVPFGFHGDWIPEL